MVSPKKKKELKMWGNGCDGCVNQLNGGDPFTV